MLSNLDKLSDQSVNTLRAINQLGIVRGADLLDYVKLRPEELQESLKYLRDADILSVSGSINDSKELMQSVFSIFPSASGLVSAIIRKRS
jgi:hypothetical protein